MTDRTTAELLGNIDEVVRGTGLWPIVHPIVKELADRLEELDAEIDNTVGTIAALAMRLAELDALRSVCPTCGGTGWQRNHGPHAHGRIPDCPDCPDGRVPFERMARIAAAVFDGDFAVRPLSRYNGEGGPEVIEYLRSIR